MVNWSGSAVGYSANKDDFQTYTRSYTGGITPGITYPRTGTNFKTPAKVFMRKMPPKEFTAVDEQSGENIRYHVDCELVSGLRI